MKVPKWVFSLKQQIVKNWEHHSICESVNIYTKWDDVSSCWSLEAEPICQEVVGGEDDGEMVWPGFSFDITKFSRSTGIWVDKLNVKSICNDCCLIPKLTIKGKFYGNNFMLSVLLEPKDDSDIKETVNYKENLVVRRGIST